MPLGPSLFVISATSTSVACSRDGRKRQLLVLSVEHSSLNVQVAWAVGSIFLQSPHSQATRLLAMRTTIQSHHLAISRPPGAMARAPSTFKGNCAFTLAFFWPTRSFAECLAAVMGEDRHCPGQPSFHHRFVTLWYPALHVSVACGFRTWHSLSEVLVSVAQSEVQKPPTPIIDKPHANWSAAVSQEVDAIIHHKIKMNAEPPDL